MIVVGISGKWQRRIVQTLIDAGGACTTRQLRIRCGMLQDKYGTLMRSSLAGLLAKGVLISVGRGLWTIAVPTAP